jgi:transcription-repair coupling factor (superfamily II helicase)
VRELRGTPAQAEIEPEIQLGIPAFIPEAYVADVSQRLVVYKRLAGIRGVPDLEEIAAELADRYGPLPPQVDTLLRLMELRRWLKDLRIIRARRRGEGVVLEFDAGTPLEPERVLAFVGGSKGLARMAGGSALEIRPTATDHDGMIAELRAHLQRLSAA